MDASRNARPETVAPLARRLVARPVVAPRLAARLASLAATATTVALLLATLAGAARAAGDPVVRSGKWSPKKVPAGWVVIETEHYQVQSECGKEKAKLLSAHLESMLELYESFLPTRRKLDGFVLKLFKDEKSFHAYGGPPGALAYYNQGDGELVGFDTGIIFGRRDVPARLSLAEGAGKNLSPERRARLDALFEEITDSYTMDTARILSHEGWHQYFHFYTVSIVTMPSWLDEGVGDYFFMASRDEQNGDKHGYRLGDLNDHRMRTLQRAFVDGTSVSFQTLLGFAQDNYYKNASVYYAQGWSMVQYLMQNEAPAMRELIPKLIKDFKDNKNREKSTTKAFKGTDMEALDRAWIAWALEQKPIDPIKTLAREFGSDLVAKDFAGEKRLVPIFEWYVLHPEMTAEAGAHGADKSLEPGSR